ncbi:damage-control phosphatase ARMT1 family protein [Thermofilum pendens]|uniref:Damage-control phosphatase ARMT1-like metal-binding domain-containing protein n=1 Tax=Thermofilum pendens (strain DSM 2475 / Hrk 5) TaxID=368408 RepID=A1RW76_THEPD|nr:ARMT1-like domain-containing protein [Thermofilum pendens]ABL77456.1 protein of unknown function DUF89 [Thermofilum pendens Hrk 5]
MRIHPECVLCIYRTRAGEVLASNLSDEAKVEALGKLTVFYGGLVEPSSSTVVLAWKAFRKVKELLGAEDPYRYFKEQSHAAAMSVVERLAARAEGLEGYERFKYFLSLSVAANLVDPGSPMGVSPEQLLEKASSLRFARDETDRLYLTLLQSSRVTYLLDNCGEAVFDGLVLRELRRMGIQLKIVAKGAPYQNDVTHDDALRMGFQELGEVVSTGSDFPGVVPGYVSEEAVKALEWADVVISKGMANFEAFLMSPPKTAVFVAFVAKCRPIAQAARVNPGDAVAAFLRYPQGLRQSL